MNKSTITRERVVSLIAEHSYDSALVDALEHLLAAMDSEPVAEVVSLYGGPEAFGEREIRPLVGIQQMPYGAKLYRHAQPDASHLSRICAESYQVVGALAEALRIFNDVGVIKALDNLSAQEIIHDDVLPFSVPEAAQPAPVVLEIPDEMTPEQAYGICDYHGDQVDVFARGANWMLQHIIDSTSSTAPQEEKK